MSNPEQYKRIYSLLLNLGEITKDKIDEVVRIAHEDFPIDHGGGNFPTVTVQNNGNFSNTITEDTLHKLNM